MIKPHLNLVNHVITEQQQNTKPHSSPKIVYPGHDISVTQLESLTHYIYCTVRLYIYCSIDTAYHFYSNSIWFYCEQFNFLVVFGNRFTVMIFRSTYFS